MLILLPHSFFLGGTFFAVSYSCALERFSLQFGLFAYNSSLFAYNGIVCVCEEQSWL